VVYFVVAVQLVEGKGSCFLSSGSCSTHQNHLMVGGEKIHQSQLDAAGQMTPIQLSYQSRLVGVHGGMVESGQLGGIRQLQSIHGVQTQAGEDRLDETQTFNDPYLQPSFPGQGQDALHRGLTDQGMARHSIDHSLGALSQGQHLSGYLLVDLRKVRFFLVEVIEGVKGKVKR